MACYRDTFTYFLLLTKILLTHFSKTWLWTSSCTKPFSSSALVLGLLLTADPFQYGLLGVNGIQQFSHVDVRVHYTGQYCQY
jgi:hypothetical protein